MSVWYFYRDCALQCFCKWWPPGRVCELNHDDNDDDDDFDDDGDDDDDDDYVWAKTCVCARACMCKVPSLTVMQIWGWWQNSGKTQAIWLYLTEFPPFQLHSEKMMKYLQFEEPWTQRPPFYHIFFMSTHVIRSSWTQIGPSRIVPRKFANPKFGVARFYRQFAHWQLASLVQNGVDVARRWLPHAFKVVRC